MANQFSQPSGSVATSTTAKTIVGLITPSTMSALIIGLEFSSDAASVTTGQYLVELVRFTTDGTGSAGTPAAYGISQDAVVSSTKTNYTVEPTTGTVISALWIPATQAYDKFWPLGREIKVPVSRVLGVRVTAPSGTPNVRATLIFEE